MSDKIQDHVFNLIQSMNKSEKRYFKIYASKHVIGESNNYEALFDFLAKQEVYAEPALRKHFFGQAMLNNFTITLHRLYDHLLKALEAYHSATSVSIELRHLLNYAEILLGKSMYAACEKMCNKIEKTAKETSSQVAIIEVNAIQKKLLEIKNYEKTDTATLENISKNEAQAIANVDSIAQLWYAKSQILQKLNTTGSANTDTERQWFEQLSASISKPISIDFEEQYLYLHAKAAAAFALGKHTESLGFILQNLELIESKPEIKKQNPHRYLSLVSNAIYFYQLQLNFDSVELWLGKLKELRQIQEVNEDLTIKIFNSSYSTELMVNNHMGHYEKNIQLCPEILNGLRNYQGKISGVRELYFYYLFVISYLAMGQTKKANKYIQTILNSENSRNSLEILSATKILQLLVLLENKESQLLPHAMKAAKRHLVNQQKFGEFEKLLFKTIEKQNSMNHTWDKEEVFADFCELLDKNATQFQKSALFHIFPFRCWAESKYKSSDLSSCVKNQFHKPNS
jgi:hypothetical protein